MSSERKLSVLFVDDEPALLSLIPRLLADMNADWRMEFAENAAKALEVMARVPIDVVVSDLHMPDKNGIELLLEIRDLHPLTARILYSSFSDQWTILRCIGLAHQFLPKPCPREAFKTAIERAALLNSSLPNRDIREKISKLECIPSMPAVYRELRQKLQSMETPLEDIAALVRV
jgi:response regulator RpfG family c-di-GMP phosphodiesterase